MVYWFQGASVIKLIKGGKEMRNKPISEIIGNIIGAVIVVVLLASASNNYDN